MLKGRKGKLAILAGVIMVALLAVNIGMAAQAITGQDVDKIVIGTTTEAQITSMFGPPQKTEAVGEQRVMYYQVSAPSPVTKSNVCNLLTVTIAKNGTVDNYVYKEYCE
jgi:hypothetical protein